MAFKQKLWSVSVTTIPTLSDALADTLQEHAVAVTILTPRKGSVRIEALFDHAPDPVALNAPLSIIAALHQAEAPRVEIKEVPKLDWLEKVAADFPPLHIGRWTIHGAHYRKAVTNRRYALQIDATYAFGTGEHPTTRGVLLMLEWWLKKRSFLSPRGRGRVLDMGCGTGILAMAYAKARHGKVTAVDIDPDAIEVSKSNISINGLQKNIRVGISHGYNSPLVRHSAPYDLIMSNILARPLCHMAKDLKQHLRPGGTAILSGILTHQANMVISAHRLQGLYLVKHLRIGDWSVLALQSRTGAL